MKGLDKAYIQPLAVVVDDMKKIGDMMSKTIDQLEELEHIKSRVFSDMKHDEYVHNTGKAIKKEIAQSNSQLLDSLEKEVEAEDERLRDTLLKIDANVPGYQKYEREGINSMLVQNKWFNDLINNLKKGL